MCVHNGLYFQDHGYYEQLWNMAVLAGPNEKLDAAKYLENAEKPQYDKAVILYEKAGYAGKALELAFETKQHNVLQYIASNFNENTGRGSRSLLRFLQGTRPDLDLVRDFFHDLTLFFPKNFDIFSK